MLSFNYFFQNGFNIRDLTLNSYIRMHIYVNKIEN